MGQKEKQDKLLSQRYYSERKNKKLFHLPGQSKEKGKKKKRKKETSHKPLLASCTFRGQERRAETMVASTQVILKGIV